MVDQARKLFKENLPFWATDSPLESFSMTTQDIFSEVEDILIVNSGDKVPTDGIIITGDCFVDESMITGESIPVEKNIKDLVIGGTINKLGSFKFKATKIGADTTLAQIIKLVE